MRILPSRLFGIPPLFLLYLAPIINATLASTFHVELSWALRFVKSFMTNNHIQNEVLVYVFVSRKTKYRESIVINQKKRKTKLILTKRQAA